MRVILYFIGKLRDRHAGAMAEEFVKRTTRYAHCEMKEVEPRRIDPWVKHPAATRIVLDPAGRLMNSREFTELIGKAEANAKILTFEKPKLVAAALAESVAKLKELKEAAKAGDLGATASKAEALLALFESIRATVKEQ